MTSPPFIVLATSAFDRQFRKLRSRHRELASAYEKAVSTLETDPYNRSRTHQIKKLEDVSAGEARYRIRFGRFRFRYDIEGQTVYLKRCSLRREDTYD